MMKKISRFFLVAGLMFTLKTGTALAIIAAPGLDPGTPLVSVQQPDGSYRFAYIVSPGVYLYIDPDIAIGYDYQILSGPNIASMLLPSVAGDDGLYDLWLWDSGSSAYTDAGTTIAANAPYFFDAGGVDRFRIMGIETTANLDPENPTAFVTGLSFVDSGLVDLTQTPVTTTVPEPSALFLLCTGIAGLAAGRFRRNR
ncbi:MAG: PEP-CTERM sorting domain-containing protein [Chlorobiaceae bacterium]|nr:PEP-CTERM sorting domain-containing protein [Chlorobiaceae bacterium]